MGLMARGALNNVFGYADCMQHTIPNFVGFSILTDLVALIIEVIELVTK